MSTAECGGQIRISNPLQGQCESYMIAQANWRALLLQDGTLIGLNGSWITLQNHLRVTSAEWDRSKGAANFSWNLRHAVGSELLTSSPFSDAPLDLRVKLSRR